MIRAGYYQFRPTFGQVQKNIDKVISTLQNISADLIVLPELAFTGYYFKNREETWSLAENPQNSATVEQLVNLCKKQKFYLVTGFAEKQNDKVFNSALLLGPEGLLHVYRKLHLFNEEKHWFDPGDTPLEVQEIKGVKIGIMICFDWIFPEVTRILALQGAQIICHPSNLVLNYCQQTMLARCLENGVFTITANRFGTDKRPHGSIRFTGKSQVVATKGELLHRAPSQKEELFITDLDPDLALDKQITPLNQIFEDRRPEYYAKLCEFVKNKNA